MTSQHTRNDGGGYYSRWRAALKRTASLVTMSLVAALAFATLSTSAAVADDSKPLDEWFSNPRLSAVVAGLLSVDVTDEVSGVQLASVPRLSVFDASVGVESLTELAPLTGLQTIDLRQQQLTDFQGAGAFPQLTILRVNSSPVASLDGIGEATSVTELSLGYDFAPTFADDPEVLAPLSSLTSLVTLFIRGTSINGAHFGHVQLAPSVNTLVLNENKIDTLDHLGYLTNLSTLNLSDNKLLDISAVAGLARLTSLDVSNANHGMGNNGAVFGKGTNSLIDFSAVNLTQPGGPNLTLYMDRQSAFAEFEYVPEDDVYVYNLSNIGLPSASVDIPYVAVRDVDLQQGSEYNEALQRIELSPAEFAALSSDAVLFEASIVRRTTNTGLGRIFFYGAARAETFAVTYTDGVDGAEVFPDQVTDGLEAGVATPAFEGTPSRAGFTFDGWAPAVAATVSADVTYVAQWVAVPAMPGTPGTPGTPTPVAPEVPKSTGTLAVTGTDLGGALVSGAAALLIMALGIGLLAKRRRDARG